MKRITIALVVIVLFATALVVATSGAPGSDVVTHEETNVLELQPDSEDGVYTQIDDETGEIEIVLTEENPNVNANGVNPNALTDIGPVFTVKNILEEQSNATVWIGHDSDAVQFYVPEKGLVESEENGVWMQPGDSATVAMRVDTRDTNEVTLGSIDVLATLDSDVPTETEESTQGGVINLDFSSESETPEPTPTETDDSTPDDSTPGSTEQPTPTDTPAQDDDDVDGSALFDAQEVAGLDATVVGGIMAIIAALGGGTFLARRIGLV